MKPIKLWLATIATLLCSLTASAYDFEVNGIYYNFVSASDLTIEVTSGDNYYSGDVIIPSTINYSGKTMTVTSIDDFAFSHCAELIGVTIPYTVTNIGLGLFSYCEGLTNIVVESGNRIYDSRDNCNAIIETNSNTLIAGSKNTTIPNSVTNIGRDAFSGCLGLTSITIPNSVTSIGYSAFHGCQHLTSIAIPKSVTDIETFAFTGCSELTNFTIPNSVISIGDRAFEDTGWWNDQQDGLVYKDDWLLGYKGSSRPIFDIVVQDGTRYIAQHALAHCTGITSVKIPNSVLSIGEYAFWNCSGLTSIQIPNSVTSIGEYAFWYCSGLTSVSIPNSVTSIGTGAFSDCNAIEKLELNCSKIDSWFWNNQSIKEVIIGNNVASIGSTAFYLCSGLTSVTIGNSVTSIGERAFYGCSGLTSITIPNCVTSIGEYAFGHCSGLTSVTIPNSVASIKEYAFENCAKLKRLTIGNSVTSIGDGAFSECNVIETIELNCPKIDSWFRGNQSLKEIIIGDNVTSIGDEAFANCSGLTNVSISNSVTSIGNSAFHYCSRLTNVSISNSVTSIGNSAFHSCSELTSITIPNGVTSIGNGAFASCSGLTSIAVPNSVTSIGDEAFANCSGLTSVVIPNSVTNIENSTFYGCDKLTSITIPNSVTSIGDEAFANCSGLTNITIPNSVTSIADNAFMYCYAIEKLELNCPVIDSWFSDKQSIKEVIIGNNVTSIGSKAFYLCSGLTSITIPNSVSNIGEYAFYGCSGITDITIPNSVTSIGERAFEGTAWYDNQPDGIVYAGNVLYKYKGTMLGDTDITIAEGTLGITGSAFQYCSGLTSITIPNSVSNIGEYAFEGCYALEKIISFIPAENLFVPDDYAFDVVTKETCTLYVPEGDVSAYESAAGWNEFEHIVDFDLHFTIIYVVDGEVYSTETAEYGSEVLLIDEPIREGYTFSGWSEVPESMPADDITIYGTFTANKYLVTFKVGDEVIFSEYMEYGASIVAPDAPEKEGHTFNGWGEVDATVLAHDVSYEGNYSVNSYQLTYVVDGETVHTESVAYGTTIKLIDDPVKEGHTFSGWSEVHETMPANDVTISGTFTINKYLVTFKIGDEMIAVDSLEYGAAIVAPEALEREGHTFNGWGEVPETMPANDITVYGTFTANKYLVTFKVGDEVIFSEYMEYGASIVAPDAPEKEGYTFNGWGEVDATVPAHDVSYEGNYSVNSYQLTYVVDGETMQTESVVYGTAITLVDEPTKEGHTFSGWGEIPETMPAHDVTLNGTFTVNKYLVTFTVDGAVIASDSLAYGTAITVPTMPEREGYTFSGWSEVDATVPAHDVTYDASYRVNTYKVYYFVGATLVHTAEVAYGEAIPEYVYEPTAEGDVFMGWIGESYDTMPAHDVTYTANITNDVLQLTNDNSQLTIYDLSGRKVTDTENLKGGVYIVNGKKIFINIIP